MFYIFMKKNFSKYYLLIKQIIFETNDYFGFIEWLRI